jgi:hypothetical protein
MPLHYDWTRTENHEAMSNELKYAACMSTMVTGVGDLSTPKTFTEYLLRLKAYEAWYGPLWVGATAEGSPEGLAREASKFRGLRTNVTLEPRTKWVRRMMDAAP